MSRADNIVGQLDLDISLSTAYAYKTFSKPPGSYLVKKPAVPESDFSGVIVGGKTEGTDYKPGQEVFGLLPGQVVSVHASGCGVAPLTRPTGS